MTDTMSYQRWIGRTLMDRDGSKIGRIDQIYVDEQTGRPAWMTVHTGLFGTRTSFVPLQEASPAGADLAVPYTKDEVKKAPNIEPDGRLEPREEQALYQHYSVAWQDGSRGLADPGPVGSDGRTETAMTRSEEELRVGKESVESGRARLRKYVDTEDVQPVSHEEVRVEREPITDANRRAATRGPEISEAEHEVVLHEERPVVAKEVVPKERVRLETDVATEEYPVADQIRKERIEAEGLDSRPRR